ncbi:MAG: hypothetical protein HQK49_10795 [Oligoflexia bacterium]|nr:hypothetical protein [Oligoflexia bacterium]
MDDDVLIKQFNEIKSAGVQSIIDFHAGYLTMRRALYFRITETTLDFLKSNPNIKNLVQKILLQIKQKNILKKIDDHCDYKGKFHGYWRTEKELKRLYKAAGWSVAKKTDLKNSYKHIAILT